MNLPEEVALNQFGQGLRPHAELLGHFHSLPADAQRHHLQGLIDLIQQSKVCPADIEPAIAESGPRPTYTPCVVLRTHGLVPGVARLLALPLTERERAYHLLYLFKQAYQRRFAAEKNDPTKWWYWDLSTPDTVDSLLNEQPEKPSR
ncbi:DUF5958 family protein [Hymenobacter sp. YC55]|uniref:DUF5958 family protein n=1 Tax=Hymenobacter sp. YC55 TaxID=3034019 RepID=UPI0023F917EE|nr:DUF5958 family protein [Hymenobacter sp. YC55]MDF7815209.1 DUF5958 family protein [Hymenobacter sp. YC55]